MDEKRATGGMSAKRRTRLGYVQGVQVNSELQLSAIAETLATAAELDIRLWLRGGWAMDFFLGQVTRAHQDIDWFVLVEDAPPLRRAMTADGFVDVTTAPVEQQLDLKRGAIDHGFAFLRLADGVPVVAGGPWAGEPWPITLLGDHVGRIGEVTAPIISPAAQIEIKTMMPEWNPSLPRRQKDLDDIAAITHALRRAQSASPSGST